MARPRKPTAHLELVGAFDKNPQRKRDSEPVCTDPVGPPPDRLTELQSEAWEYLSASAVPGVLTKMDRAYLELCAIALAVVWDWNTETEKSMKLPMAIIKDTGNMLGKLGMTPSDRSKVVVPKDKPTGPKRGKL